MTTTKLERDAGMVAAIEAVSGVIELSRRLDCDKAAVSRWRRVPAHRIIDVERVTGVSRTILRPDLYGPREGI